MSKSTAVNARQGRGQAACDLRHGLCACKAPLPLFRDVAAHLYHTGRTHQHALLLHVPSQQAGRAQAHTELSTGGSCLDDEHRALLEAAPWQGAYELKRRAKLLQGVALLEHQFAAWQGVSLCGTILRHLLGNAGCSCQAMLGMHAHLAPPRA